MSNHFTITGNLAAPVELRFTQGGQAVASMRVADTPRRKNEQTGQWEDAGETLWVDVSVWGEEGEALAERAADYRGRVTCTGRLGVRTYQAKDGTDRQVVTLRADAVALHAPKRADRGQAPQQAPQQQSQGDPWRAQQPSFDEPPF